MRVDCIRRNINNQAFEYISNQFPQMPFLYRSETQYEQFELLTSAIFNLNARHKMIAIHEGTSKFTQDIISIEPNANTLCEALATSSDRIAAIIFSHRTASHFFQKKMRELASAEGAWLVLDVTSGANLSLAKSIQFDIILFQYGDLFWLASKSLLNIVDNLTVRLINGCQIQQLNQDETDFVYHEIFVDDCYGINQLKLAQDAVILDIGANIGLFTLFIKSKYPKCQVVAFEPSPYAYSLLQSNTQSYEDSVRVFPYAITNQSRELIFHYYQNFSVISGFAAEQKKDAAIISQGMSTSSDEVKNRIKNRLRQLNSIRCFSYALSDVLKLNALEKIDLLKIDIEGEELNALQGIEEDDWQKIKNISLEVHHSDLLIQVTSLLEEQGFHVRSVPDKKLGKVGIYNLIAKM